MNAIKHQLFHPSRVKWVGVFFLSLAFMLAGVWILDNAHSFMDRSMAWLCIVFFGLGYAVATVSLIPSSSYLLIDGEGIRYCSLWRGRSYRWSDIETFGVAEIQMMNHGLRQRHRMVGFTFSATYHGQGKLKSLRELSTKLSGYEAALPDTYGWDCQKLADYLNQQRESYLQTNIGPGPDHHS